MKIIFLDIDDVINIKWKSKWDKTAIYNLNEIIKNTGAKIVVTSTWRIAYDLPKLKEIFQKQGIVGEVISVTPILNMDRGHEILEWLKENKDISNFAVIDDKILGIKGYINSEYIFKVDVNKGLRDLKITNNIINHLIGQSLAE